MDYKPPLVRQSDIRYTVDENRQFGQLPNTMLVAKFEETDMGPDENLYEDFARDTLIDKSPDTNLFAHEEPRGAVNARAGRIQLLNNGHRGDANDPHHPEIFLGFLGPEDSDPRGIAVDPDFKQLKRQHEARMRFQRFTPDGSDWVTGGGRSQFQAMQDQQTLLKWVRERLKVFSQSKDCRKEGLRRIYTPTSDASKQIIVQSYGDRIKDFALNPVKRATHIADAILRDTRWYRDGCTDGDLAIAQLGGAGRRVRGHRQDDNPTRLYTTEADFSESDRSKLYRSAAVLLSELARMRSARTREGMSDGLRTSEADEVSFRARKRAILKDLAVILGAIDQDSEYGDSDSAAAMKSRAVNGDFRALMDGSIAGHILPAHYYLSAEKIYKSLREGDPHSAQRQAIVDNTVPEGMYDAATRTGGKAARSMVPATGGKWKSRQYVDVETESTHTPAYKTSVEMYRGGVNLGVSVEGFAGQSKITPARRTLDRVAAGAADASSAQVDETGFYQNHSKERYARGLGTKYLVRMMDRDARGNEIATAS